MLNAFDSVGGNVLYGQKGNDELWVSHDSYAYGGDGDDHLVAQLGQGNNYLEGGKGDDEIIVGSYDKAYGGSGDDWLNAQFSQTDTLLRGGYGDDEFTLGARGRAIGGQGDDKFVVLAGGGNRLTGGGGADEFWLASGYLPASANYITDFTIGEDRLGVNGLNLGIGNIALAQSGEDTIVSIKGEGPLAILEGVKAIKLSLADFLFT